MMSGTLTKDQMCISKQGHIRSDIREGCTNENPEKVWSFAKPGRGGGGGSRRVVKCQTSILEKYF